MNTTIVRGALALPLLLCAIPALADESHDQATDYHSRPDSHAPAGVMADHVHQAGDVMIGLTWMHSESGGTNRSGTDDIADAAIVAAGYTARVQHMTMDMAMLHLMWAPSDRVTLMVMPSWQKMSMTMLGLAPGMAHGGHMPLGVGQTMSHGTEGFGDTQVGALVSLSRNPGLSAHAGLMLSVPTGRSDIKDAEGNFVHYGMQPGSGTWDLIPSLTLRGYTRQFGWGAQASYVARTGEENASGFKFGNRFEATAWLSKPIAPKVTLSGRLAWSDEGAVKGHYNAGHNHAAPPDRQANYGGQRLDAGIGFNAILPGKVRLGVEAVLPLYQSLNGIQAPRTFATSVNLSRAF
jgi:hypothetical protein